MNKCELDESIEEYLLLVALPYHQTDDRAWERIEELEAAISNELGFYKWLNFDKYAWSNETIRRYRREPAK